MKKTRGRTKKSSDDLRSEYRVDYSKSKPNRFAAKLKKGGRLVVLDPEIADVFHDSEDVNKALRAIVAAMPGK